MIYFYISTGAKIAFRDVLAYTQKENELWIWVSIIGKQINMHNFCKISENVTLEIENSVTGCLHS